jgi:hypothetical protein
MESRNEFDSAPTRYKIKGDIPIFCIYLPNSPSRHNKMRNEALLQKEAVYQADKHKISLSIFPPSDRDFEWSTHLQLCVVRILRLMVIYLLSGGGRTRNILRSIEGNLPSLLRICCIKCLESDLNWEEKSVRRRVLLPEDWCRKEREVEKGLNKYSKVNGTSLFR